MQSPDNKVDMAQMNATIDKLLAFPAVTQAQVKERRTQRKTNYSPVAMTGRSAKHPVGS